MSLRFMTTVVVGALLTSICTTEHATAQEVTDLFQSRDEVLVLELTERVRIGSWDGPDAFGRVMDIAKDSRGRLFVADDLNSRIVVFDPAGAFLQFIGRSGQGPGEFQSPWRLVFDSNDTLFVWDAGRSNISVFSPDLEYVRQFLVPPGWLVGSIAMLPPGDILMIAAFHRTDRRGIHWLDRAGNPTRSFGTVEVQDGLGGFEGSLLGGSLTYGNGLIAYTNKSPYRIDFYDRSGSAIRVCRGPRDWTTEPSEVVVQDQRGAGLRWNAYVHSARILHLSDGLFLNVVHDPVQDRQTLDVVTARCELLTRYVLSGPVNVMTVAAGTLAAVWTTDYPQVVVYELEVQRR